MFKEEAERYNDVMSDVATGEHRGGEARRSGGTRNVTFLRDWNFWQRSLLLAQDRVFLRNSDAQEMNSHSIYRLKRSLRFLSPQKSYILHMHPFCTILEQHPEGRMWLRLALETSTFHHSKAGRNGERALNHVRHQLWEDMLWENWTQDHKVQLVWLMCTISSLWLCYQDQLWYTGLTKIYIG